MKRSQAVRPQSPRAQSPRSKQTGTLAKRAPSGYVLLLGLVVVLNVIGLVMVLSASSVYSLRESGSAWEYFLKQSIWLGLGSVTMLITLRVDYHHWRKFAAPLLGVGLFLLLIVLVPGVGIRVNGAKSWLGLGPTLRIQPAELVKFALLLFTADLLARREHRMNQFGITVRPVLAVLAVVSVLMMAQPDLGSTLVMMAIVFAVFFVAGVPLSSLSGLGLVAGVIAV
ncbi:MAG: FtsW/RodA/SpoVE family cell cycle protein, partial [Acidimicrobiales bacterium]